jgi:iron(III) transport system substrate-binding protein
LAKYKGRIAIYSPTLGGALHEWHYHLLQTIGKERYESFIQALVGDLDAAVVTAPAAAVAQVASGELAAIVGATASTSIPTINAGAPAKLAYTEPVTYYRSSLQAMAKAPHPNAAKLFINWLISEEGAKAACSNGVCAPPQFDIEGQIEIPESADFVDGIEARKTGDEYVNELVAKVAG